MPVLALLAGAVLSWWWGGYVHHDTLPILTRMTASPSWLRDANGYPLEVLLMALVRLLPGDARFWWNVLGCLHLGALAWLVARLASQAAPGRKMLPWLAPLLALANPYTLRFVLGLNSVTQLSLCLLLWSLNALGESSRGQRVALAVLALSRLEGLLFAFALAIAMAARWRKEGGARQLAGDLLVLVPVAVSYPLLWKVLFGQWLGLTKSLQQFEAIIGFRPMGFLEMIHWLRGAWLGLSGDAFLLLAFAGVLLLLADRARWSLLLPLLAPAALVHGFAIVSGMLGKPIGLRYFWPVIPFAALWVSIAVVRIGERIGRTRREQIAAALILTLAGCAPYLLSLEKLGAIRQEQQAIRADAAAVARCWRERAPVAPTLLVVPGGIRGDVIYAVSDATSLAEVLFEKAYFFEPARYAGMPALWFASGQYSDRAPGMPGLQDFACGGFSGPGAFTGILN